MKIQISLWLLLIPFSSIFLRVSGQCLDDQKTLLMQLKDDFVFDWNQTVDCCRWDGVECDTTGHIIGLDLSNRITEGVVNDSSSLFGLTYLQTLNLAYSNFDSAQLPSGFGKLTRLNHLNLSNANFEGQVPREFSLMTKLVTLDLSSSPHYALTLEDPDLKTLIENLTELKQLYLDNINVTTNGYRWSEVLSSSLPNLQVLSLPGCGLSGPLDSSLASLKRLSVVVLDENAFSSGDLESFAELQNLTVLSLRACNLSGSFPKKIFQVPTLKTIDLSSNVILEGPLPGFPSNGSLENLVLSYTEIGGNLPDSIGGLGMLSRIELRGCNFGGSIPDSMQNLTRLNHLDLSANRFMGSIPSFHLCKNLAIVFLQQNNLTGEMPSFHWQGLDDLVFLDLGYNSLSGSFPGSLLTLPSLQVLYLSNNRLSGQFSEFVNVSAYQLSSLDLGSNRFEGPMPGFVFKLPRLLSLSLSSNNFTGSVDLNMFGKFKNLSSLDLSFNGFSVGVNSKNPGFSSLTELGTLKLASCSIQELPDVKNQSGLMQLDFSDNKLSGEIPSWIWGVGNGLLRFLNFSHNEFSSLEKPYTFPFLLDVLDLHSNHLQGDIPIPPRRIYYLDYSNNKFRSSFPVEFGNFLTSTFFFSISNNEVAGFIPQSICNVSNLSVLDLSNNSLNGTIPSCLAQTSKTLRVLNLRRNNLSGKVFDAFPESCVLQTLDLSGNRLQGPFPKSLANCKSIEVLDLGNNMITDTFPCLLKNSPDLRVFVIRSNSFHGELSCLWSNHNWMNLQIIDIAHNRFSGVLPPKLFSGLNAMIFDKFGNQSELSYLHFQSLVVRDIYYQDSVTVVFKGESRELVKILTIFTSIDFSSNSFQGSIPDTVGDLKMLKVLNFSENTLMGPVPLSIGKLKNLESLDLSVNKLSGSIPVQVASLNFLSFLNLSYNRLSGSIPKGSQFQTFTEASFVGNQGLCGPPLNKSCDDDPSKVPRVPPPTHGDSDLETGIYVSVGLGFLVGFTIVVGPLVFFRRLRTWYSNQVDRIILRILKTSDKERKGSTTIEYEESLY